MRAIQKKIATLHKSDLEKSVLKSTWNDEYAAPKKKHLQICAQGFGGKGTVDSFAMLSSYLKQVNINKWVFSAKILHVAHFSLVEACSPDLADYLVQEEVELKVLRQQLLKICKQGGQLDPSLGLLDDLVKQLIFQYYDYILKISKHYRELFTNSSIKQSNSIMQQQQFQMQDSNNSQRQNQQFNNNYIQSTSTNNNIQADQLTQLPDSQINSKTFQAEDSLQKQQILIEKEIIMKGQSYQIAECNLRIGESIVEIVDKILINFVDGRKLSEKYQFFKVIMSLLLTDLFKCYQKVKTYWLLHEGYLLQAATNITSEEQIDSFASSIKFLEKLYKLYEGLIRFSKLVKKVENYKNLCMPFMVSRLPIEYFCIDIDKNRKIELFYNHFIKHHPQNQSQFNSQVSSTLKKQPSIDRHSEITHFCIDLPQQHIRLPSISSVMAQTSAIFQIEDDKFVEQFNDLPKPRRFILRANSNYVTSDTHKEMTDDEADSKERKDCEQDYEIDNMRRKKSIDKENLEISKKKSRSCSTEQPSTINNTSNCIQNQEQFIIKEMIPLVLQKKQLRLAIRNKRNTVLSESKRCRQKEFENNTNKYYNDTLNDSQIIDENINNNNSKDIGNSTVNHQANKVNSQQSNQEIVDDSCKVEYPIIKENNSFENSDPQQQIIDKRQTATPSNQNNGKLTDTSKSKENLEIKEENAKGIGNSQKLENKPLSLLQPPQRLTSSLVLSPGAFDDFGLNLGTQKEFKQPLLPQSTRFTSNYISQNRALPLRTRKNTQTFSFLRYHTKSQLQDS